MESKGVMGYEASLKKAWGIFRGHGKRRIKFLNDEYELDFSKKTVFSLSCDIEAKDYYKILMLHYLANENKVEDIKKDKWISFKELEGGKEYFPAFSKRAIGPLLKKYSDNPMAIFEWAKTLNAEKMDMGNAAISITALPKIKVGIVLWAKDEEFEAGCNMLFNESAKEIFPTEDIAVLGGIIASRA